MTFSVVRISSFIVFAIILVRVSAHAQSIPEPQAPPWSSLLETPALESVETPEWLELSGLFRFRFENRRGLGFREGADDSYGLFRTRFNLGIRPHEQVRLFVQVQDTRAPGIRPTAATGASRDPLDLRQGYLEIGTSADSPWVLTVGRQALGYGDQRLIGPLEWANSARSFDAVKLGVRTGPIDADVFASTVVRNDPERRINHPVAGDNLHGLYIRMNNLPGDADFEPFLFWRTRPQVQGVSDSGDMDQYTAGFYTARRQLPGWEYIASFAKQWGNFADQTIDAQFFSLLGGYSFDALIRPRVFLEYNFASGDADPTDDRLEGFDNLYPTAHIYYGHNDLVGLRNIKNLRLGASVRAGGRLTLGVDFHSFWLADTRDNQYNAGGAVSVPVPLAGASDAKVGDELDISATLPVGNIVVLSGGAGMMFPGQFLEDSSPGDGNAFVYLSLDYRF